MRTQPARLFGRTRCFTGLLALCIVGSLATLLPKQASAEDKAATPSPATEEIWLYDDGGGFAMQPFPVASAESTVTFRIRYHGVRPVSRGALVVESVARYQACPSHEGIDEFPADVDTRLFEFEGDEALVSLPRVAERSFRYCIYPVIVVEPYTVTAESDATARLNEVLSSECLAGIEARGEVIPRGEWSWPTSAILRGPRTASTEDQAVVAFEKLRDLLSRECVAHEADGERGDWFREGRQSKCTSPEVVQRADRFADTVLNAIRTAIRVEQATVEMSVLRPHVAEEMPPAATVEAKRGWFFSNDFGYGLPFGDGMELLPVVYTGVSVGFVPRGSRLNRGLPSSVRGAGWHAGQRFNLFFGLNLTSSRLGPVNTPGRSATGVFGNRALLTGLSFRTTTHTSINLLAAIGRYEADGLGREPHEPRAWVRPMVGFAIDFPTSNLIKPAFSLAGQ